MGSILIGTESISSVANRSRIIEWDASKGFGFVDHGGKRLFVHHRDFVRRDLRPRQGDQVSFVVGTDGKGRACATLVQSLERRGQLRFRDWVVLFFLVLPLAVAVLSFPWSPWISFGYLALVSGLGYGAYRDDKKRALDGRRRRSESSLHSLDLIGAWPGSFLAQQRFRHKTAKASFQRVFRGTILLHEAVALDFLLGWPVLGRVLELITEVILWIRS